MNQRDQESGPAERSYRIPVIEPRMTVRHVVALYPDCREVFRQYGEPDDRTDADGNPGPFGHFQPISRFAAEHGVDLDQLLAQLAKRAGVPVDRDRAVAERIHHGFLLSSLLITLTIGAGWGAHMLASIGLRKNFGSVSAAEIIAHGEAQLWGFIVLFIAGVSLRTLLKDAASTRFRQRICHVALAIAILSLAGGYAWAILPDYLPQLSNFFFVIGITSAICQLLLSISLWIVQWRVVRQKWSAAWSRPIFMSGFWLTVWALLTVYLRQHFAEIGPNGFSLNQRSLIIKLAIFGFAMNSIYGFGQMLLPGLLRINKPRMGFTQTSFWLHNLGLLAIVASGIGMDASDHLIWRIVELVGSISIFAGAICFVIGQRGLIGKKRKSTRLEPGHKWLDAYPPLAFAWLIIGLLMMVAGEFVALLSGEPISHVYTGAMRHALTVGFITTLLLGVGQRLVPVFDHGVLLRPKFVAPILILIATGNLLRVTSQLATLNFPIAYSWMPYSALLEWTALLLFTMSVVKQMWPREILYRKNRVTVRTSLAALLAVAPKIEDKLIANGSVYLVRVPHVPSELTIGRYAASENRQPAELVNWINEQFKIIKKGMP